MSETEILNIIYSRYSSEKISKEENPDFYLEHDEGYKFGVEVTRYFHSQSKARLKYIPNYGHDLIDGKPYKHKDDKKEIPVEDMIYASADGKTTRKIKGIFHEGKSLNEISQNIENVIKTKNGKISNYNKELNHINLLIYDTEDCFRRWDNKAFLNMFFNKSISALIKNSPFREIYFITKNDENAKGYIPLRILHLSSQMLCFKKIFFQFAESYNVKKSFEVYYDHFMKYLSHLDYTKVYYVNNSDVFHFYYADSSLFIKDNRIHINMLGDGVYPSNCITIDMKKEKTLFDKNYELIINEFYKKTRGFLELFIKV